MRGDDRKQGSMWSYLSPEARVPADHPLRPIRAMVDQALGELDPLFRRLHSTVGRPSTAPEMLLRAIVLQILYSIRSERLLMEHLDADLRFRWFVGLNADDPVWDVTVFTKNRDRLLRGDVAGAFFAAVLAQAGAANLLSDGAAHLAHQFRAVATWAAIGQRNSPSVVYDRSVGARSARTAAARCDRSSSVMARRSGSAAAAPFTERST